MLTETEISQIETYIRNHADMVEALAKIYNALVLDQFHGIGGDSTITIHKNAVKIVMSTNEFDVDTCLIIPTGNGSIVEFEDNWNNANIHQVYVLLDSLAWSKIEIS